MEKTKILVNVACGCCGIIVPVTAYGTMDGSILTGRYNSICEVCGEDIWQEGDIKTYEI